MIRVSVSETRETFATLLKHVLMDGETVLIDRHGCLLAALVPVDDLNAICDIEEDARDRRAAREALEGIKINGSVSWDDLKKELEIES